MSACITGRCHDRLCDRRMHEARPTSNSGELKEAFTKLFITKWSVCNESNQGRYLPALGRNVRQFSPKK
jgi:hypothetical protein